MNVNIENLLKQENPEKDSFMNRIKSTLTLDINRNEVVEDNEWLDKVEFTIPHIEKALNNPNKYIVTEEEIIKIELIKKVTVESIKHLSKHVNLVDEFDEDTMDIKPSRLLNAYKEENFVTYENRFIYSLIKLIEDVIFLRTSRTDDEEYKSKNKQLANYEGTSRVKNKKLNLKLEYSIENLKEQQKDNATLDRIKELKNNLRMLKQTEIYQLLDSKRVTLVKSPLKMTNVLLKNVHFQYAVKLWNYLNNHLDAQNDVVQAKNNYEDKSAVKDLADENFYVNYLIYNAVNDQVLGKRSKMVSPNKRDRDKMVGKMIDEILTLNPDLLEKDLQQMIAERYIIFKKKKELSLRPLEIAFKKSIDKYLNKVEKIKLK